ncbi:hypothetical protein CI102_11534 [Trichoderma harzianum]|nr:hypothetical protein CI102_11534 [Trichoderma harzianum]
MAPAAYNDRDGHLEAGLLKSTQGEKQTGYQHLTQQTPSKNRKMVYFRRALFIIAVGFVLGLGVATARPSVVNCHKSNKMAVAKAHASNGELAEALQKASPDLLHRLLHAYLPERYQHGVFPSDRDAIDAIHGDDPSVASAIVQIAKRQEDTPNNNSTIPNSSSTTPPSSSSTSVQESSTSPAQSTTDSSSSSTTTPEQSSTESTTTQPASTTAGSTTSDSSSTSTPASTTAGRTTTDEQTTTNTGSATSTEPPSSTTSPSESTTTTDNSITSSTTTSEGPATTITSGTKTTSAPVLHTYTRTLPNGGTTTLTSTSWVAVVPTDQAEGSKSPDLQNAASLPRGEMVLPAVIGLLVGAVLMV